jgi:hypothetical protein
VIAHAWHQYWSWVGGNIGAMPMEGGITAGLAWMFRGPIGKLLGRDALKEARAARRIAADLHLKLTGEPHPDAPDSESEVP